MWYWPDDQKARLGLPKRTGGGVRVAGVLRLSLSAPPPLVLLHQVLGLSFHHLSISS